MAHGTASRKSMERIKARVFELWDRDPELTRKQVAERFNVSPNTASKFRKEYEDKKD